MNLLKVFLISLTLISCGTEKSNTRTKKEDNSELEQLKQQVLNIAGTISQINSFVASDFSNCDNSLPPFEKKICNIAKTATAEQMVLFTGQLQEVSKIFQNELYGPDCISTADLGCPVAGSVTARIDEVEQNVSDALSDIAILQADLAALNGTLSSINGRLNNFNGSGSSIETIVTAIQADLLTLDSRLDTLENNVNNGDIYRTHLVCGDVVASGPAFEPALITGDNLRIMMYTVSGTSNGMGVIAEAGISGTQFLSTRANTRACNFKAYDRTTSVKLCWKNTDRSANSAAIDTACNAPTFAAPLSTCTCVN